MKKAVSGNADFMPFHGYAIIMQRISSHVVSGNVAMLTDDAVHTLVTRLRRERATILQRTPL